MNKNFSIKELPGIAEEIIGIVHNRAYENKGATVIALSGDLGAGKTTLTQEIAKAYGIQENIISPTFVIMKSYQIRDPRYQVFFHIDAYRLEKDSELLKLGWEEILADPKNLILIEWPERVEKIIPKNAIFVKLEHKDEEIRSIDIELS